MLSVSVQKETRPLFGVVKHRGCMADFKDNLPLCSASQEEFQDLQMCFKSVKQSRIASCHSLAHAFVRLSAVGLVAA